jgi:hypothetical protein
LPTETLFTGTVTASAVYPREVVAAALAHTAAAVIFRPQPPVRGPGAVPDDMAITRRLVQACGLMGITVHEHLIIGTEGYFSFADHGHMARINAADNPLARPATRLSEDGRQGENPDDHEPEKIPALLWRPRNRFSPWEKKGLRQTPESCMPCCYKTECLRKAMADKGGITVREEMVDRAYASGMVGFFERWSRKKGPEQKTQKQRRKISNPDDVNTPTVQFRWATMNPFAREFIS